MTPDERFDAVVGELLDIGGVTPPGAGRGFGSAALRVDGKIFAMLAGGRLVVKLPRRRVDELVDAGCGVRFDGGKGRPMKEWLSLDPDDESSWPVLAREALAFVGAR
ncbi:TfoX/Sxy family protein [Planomonospora sp. ID82291]|uniref:TfoX/Sxy family protein n=1 Tax=Planomonospora sp. ID82291 TaxID=2738136 RepID=UPI0018C40A7A|nr:TfoX/Sxy family protein [Planomonospora sp. ID82291]MBG0817882.1 TfoX/Sxy family protein [Planomonospora sp. ID82291]